jgi:hypothetical protein
LKNKTTREHRRCEIEEAFTVFYDWRHLKKKSTESTVGAENVNKKKKKSKLRA